MLAMCMGLRGKATEIPVPSSTRSVCSAASKSGKKGSWLVSADQTASYPAASASFAVSAALLRSNPIPPSTFMQSFLLLVSQEAFELGGQLVAGRDDAQRTLRFV